MNINASTSSMENTASTSTNSAPRLHPEFDAQLDAPYSLTDEQIASFKRDGFIRLKEVFSAELLAFYGEQISRKTIEFSVQHLPIEQRSTYDKAFLQVMNLWCRDELIKQFAFGKRAARIAAQLMEVKGVRMWHDQSLYKEAGGGITPTHADQFYWPLSSDRSITAWIPLQAVSQDMGPLAFFAQSQECTYGRDIAISDESERNISRVLEAKNYTLIDEPFDLSEVSFHLGWTYHRAGANVSQTPRAVMTMIYIDSEIRLVEPVNANQIEDRATWCAGTEIGDVIATKLNPILYRADNF